MLKLDLANLRHYPKVIIAFFAILFMGMTTLTLAETNKPLAAKTDGLLDSVQAKGVIHIATNPGIEPMEYMRGGQLIGYDIDFGLELARHLKVEVKWIVIEDLDDLVKHVLEGVTGEKLDIVISSMGIDDNRTNNAIAVPYFKSGLTLLVNSADTEISTLDSLIVDSLKGNKVAAVRGSTEYGIVKQMSGITVVEARSYDECIALVLSGVASVAVLDVPVALVAAKRYPDKLRVVDHPFEEEWYGIFMDKSEIALFQALRKALKSMRQDGTLDRLYAKWF